jgi:hypothetical protein
MYVYVYARNGKKSLHLVVVDWVHPCRYADGLGLLGLDGLGCCWSVVAEVSMELPADAALQLQEAGLLWDCQGPPRSACMSIYVTFMWELIIIYSTKLMSLFSKITTTVNIFLLLSGKSFDLVYVQPTYWITTPSKSGMKPVLFVSSSLHLLATLYLVLHKFNYSCRHCSLSFFNISSYIVLVLYSLLLFVYLRTHIPVSGNQSNYWWLVMIWWINYGSLASNQQAQLFIREFMICALII